MSGKLDQMIFKGPFATQTIPQFYNLFFSTSWSINLDQWDYSGLANLHGALINLFRVVD